MTKPLVDAGTFRRVGDFTAPWPAFVVCVARSIDGARRGALQRALAIALDEARALRGRPDAAQLIAGRYALGAGDVAEWLQSTRWSAGVAIDASDLDLACRTLGSLGVLQRVVTAADCMSQGAR
jgi:hypothetical protein